MWQSINTRDVSLGRVYTGLVLVLGQACEIILSDLPCLLEQPEFDLEIADRGGFGIHLARELVHYAAHLNLRLRGGRQGVGQQRRVQHTHAAWVGPV